MSNKFEGATSGFSPSGFLRQFHLLYIPKWALRASSRALREAMQRKTGDKSSRKAIIRTVRKGGKTPFVLDHAIFQGDAEQFLASLPEEPLFDLVVTSPPYNIGKSYEKKDTLETYMAWQKRIIDLIVPRLKHEGSLCWQVGNFVDNGQIVPLDIEFTPIFKSHGLQMRNRIIWHFGHGLHARRRFSGRYEVVLWYTKTDDYYFILDAVRVPSKYPGKKHFKGPKKGHVSGNPLGKNPEDVWEEVEDVWNIPNVKSNHVEKTGIHVSFPSSAHKAHHALDEGSATLHLTRFQRLIVGRP